MAKPSKFAKKIQQQAAVKAEIHRRFALQQAQDMACIALHEAFGFGAERCERFVVTFGRIFTEYANLCLDDAKSDDEIIYTKTKVDDMLRLALGDKLVPFDERYAWCFAVQRRMQPEDGRR